MDGFKILFTGDLTQEGETISCQSNCLLIYFMCRITVQEVQVCVISKLFHRASRLFRRKKIVFAPAHDRAAKADRCRVGRLGQIAQVRSS